MQAGQGGHTLREISGKAGARQRLTLHKASSKAVPGREVQGRQVQGKGVVHNMPVAGDTT